MGSYFNTTPLNRWDVFHCTAYFNSKYKINIKRDDIDGTWLVNSRLKQYRDTFGKQLGEKIYLIVRDRLERESDVILTSVPMDMPVQYVGSPLSRMDTPIQCVGSPIISPMLISNLDLNAPLDFKGKDPTTITYLAALKKQEDFLLNKLHNIQLSNHIEKHPPLLWNDEHLHLFLTNIVKHPIASIPHVDDFIFMSAEEMDLYFPGKGSIIKVLLLSRFINPNIKKAETISSDRPVKSIP